MCRQISTKSSNNLAIQESPAKLSQTLINRESTLSKKGENPPSKKGEKTQIKNGDNHRDTVKTSDNTKPSVVNDNDKSLPKKKKGALSQVGQNGGKQEVASESGKMMQCCCVSVANPFVDAAPKPHF